MITGNSSKNSDPFLKFRDSQNVKLIISELKFYLKKTDCSLRFMEVCGTHTMSAARAGLHSILPEGLKLLSGPGCPVCVTPQGYVAALCQLSHNNNIVITTFGDMMRVPGGETTLESERARGSDVRIVYSPMDVLSFAEKEPQKEFVFAGVGFETTAPTVAATVLKARERKIKNFSVFSAHKTMPEAMRAVLNSKVKLDGFLCPGHVSVITGLSIYEFIPHEYKLPCAISGFEPVDILSGIRELLRMTIERKPAVLNTYRRVVRDNGNESARKILNRVFSSCDAEWRGLGIIQGSGLKIRDEYSEYNAENKFGIIIPELETPKGCLCGEVLRGVVEPFDCTLFDKICRPNSPVGACMVSSEGACAAAWKYKRK